jgi:hypothetical protein
MSNNNKSQETNRPAHSVRYRNIKATIWKNQTERGPMYNVTLTRSYRDGEEWRDTSSFGFDDLMTVAKALFDAHTWISSAKASDAGGQGEKNAEPTRNSSRRTERNAARQPETV